MSEGPKRPQPDPEDIITVAFSDRKYSAPRCVLDRIHRMHLLLEKYPEATHLALRSELDMGRFGHILQPYMGIVSEEQMTAGATDPMLDGVLQKLCLMGFKLIIKTWGHLVLVPRLCVDIFTTSEPTDELRVMQLTETRESDSWVMLVDESWYEKVLNQRKVVKVSVPAGSNHIVQGDDQCNVEYTCVLDFYKRHLIMTTTYEKGQNLKKRRT